MFKQQEHTLLPFPTHSMALKKTVCGGALTILLVLVTGVIVTLITLMLTKKTAPGKKHTLTTASQMPADGKSKSSLLHFCLSDRAGANPCAQPRDRT